MQRGKGEYVRRRNKRDSNYGKGRIREEKKQRMWWKWGKEEYAKRREDNEDGKGKLHKKKKQKRR